MADLTVRVTATDGASKTFTTIANSAQKMGDNLEKAGKEGAQGLKEIDAQAKTTSATMATTAEKATALGAAFGTLVSAAALLGSSYRDQERQIDGINRLYGDQADQILLMSENIQDFTRYSNDAARESALIASSLATNYGMSADEIDILIQRSADLAQIHGFTLPDAVSRTAGALRGEGEAAERLGLNMSDAAIAARALDAGITNWNVPGALTEAERAAFRFQVFLEDTATTAGAAADAADSAGGRFRQFANSVQDAGQMLGGFLGPVGQIAAEFAPLAVALPVVGAGLGRFSTVLKTTGAGARAASVGISLLGAATSPLGLALAAVATGGFLAYQYFQNMDEEARNLARTFGILDDLIEGLKLQGELGLADEVTKVKQEVTDMVNILSGSDFAEISERLQFPEGTTFLDITGPGGLQDQLADANETVDDFAQHISDTLATLPPDAQRAYLDWVQSMLDGVQYTVEGTNLDDIINDVILTPASEVPGVLDAITGSATATSQALILMGMAGKAAAIGIGSLQSEGSKLGETMVGALQAMSAAAAEAGLEQVAALQAFNDATIAYLQNGDNILDWWLAYDTAINQGAASFSGTEEQYRQFMAAVQEEADFRGLVELANSLDNAGESLDRILNVFTQIDSLGQRAESSSSIAEALIGEPGVWATIDDLLASGRIGVEQYNDAVAAGYSIQQSNLAVQEDLNAMRAAQLPLLASELAAYEAQIDAISQLPPLEQRRALAMQDSAVQAQIATQYATAYSASIGEIPTDVATSMIINAAQADPVLKDLLLQFGLIYEYEDKGEIKIGVTIPDGPTVQETIIGLTDAINLLTSAITGIPVAELSVVDNATPAIEEANTAFENYEGKVATGYVVGDNSNAMGVIDESTGALNNLDGQTAMVSVLGTDLASGVIAGASGALNALNGDSATVTVFGNDLASGMLGAVAGALSALDGRTATTYVRTVNFGGGGGLNERMGGVPGFEQGGVTFYGGEGNRPELARFANGGVGLVPHEGFWNVPPATRIVPNNGNNYGAGGGITVQIDVHGNIFGISDLTAQVARDMVPALQDVIEDVRGGLVSL